MKKFLVYKLLPLLGILLIALLGGTFLSEGSAAPLPPVQKAEVQVSEPLPSAAVTPESAESTPAPSVEETPALPVSVPETPQPTPEPEIFTLSFVGDCTLASVPAYVGTQYGYDVVVGDDYAYPFAETVQYFTYDDFTFANLECCLTDSSAAVAKTFTFKADEAYASIMSEGGVDFVTLANNHILDFGDEGVSDTEAALNSVGVAYAGRDECALYETDSGLKIGVYALSFGTTQQIKDGIAKVKAMGADFVIAALHWGDEGSYDVNSDQTAQGHAAIDAGADFVYGSHPHTLQPVEEYKGHYIYYSMGNWTFGGNTDPRDKDTFILRMTVARDADGNVSIVEREHIPCRCSGTDSGNNYQPVPCEEGSEAYERVLTKLGGSFSGENLSIGYSYSPNE